MFPAAQGYHKEDNDPGVKRKEKDFSGEGFLKSS
jgi:hypothetical protein